MVRDDDGRRTKSDHKSSPCHYVTGELKRNITQTTKRQNDGVSTNGLLDVWETILF